jgi:hypothetical protein
MRRGSVPVRSLGVGCVKHITLSMSSWERPCLTAIGGRRGGGLVGRTVVAISELQGIVERHVNVRLCVDEEGRVHNITVFQANVHSG